jgi:hypothetical protein
LREQSYLPYNDVETGYFVFAFKKDEGLSSHQTGIANSWALQHFVSVRCGRKILKKFCKKKWTFRFKGVLLI